MKRNRILAVVLSVLMLMTCFAVPSFAADDALNYVVLGDSIGWGAGVQNSTEACYGRIVANTNGYNFTNDAVNGYRTADLIRHLDKENIAADVAAADIISISIGGNDFLRGDMASLIKNAQNGDFSAFDAIAEQFNENFAVIIGKIRELNPDAAVLVQTLYNPRSDAIGDVYQQGADRLNAGYRSYLENNPGAYELVDVETALNGDPDNFAMDAIHPSAKGNVEIAKVVLEKLYELGLGENTEPVILVEGIDQAEMFSIKSILKMIINFFMNLAQIIGTIVDAIRSI